MSEERSRRLDRVRDAMRDRDEREDLEGEQERAAAEDQEPGAEDGGEDEDEDG